MNILIISDDNAIIEEPVRALLNADYGVQRLAPADLSIAETLQAIHLVLLWWPAAQAPNLRIAQLRTIRPGIPIIAVRQDEANVAATLDAGADDCMQAPVMVEELLARVRALLRRCDGELDTLKRGAIVINQRTREAWLDGTPLPLNVREFSILTMLVRRADSLVTRKEILAEVWQRSRPPTSNLIEVYIRHLRTKLGALAHRLQTVRGKGYVFVTQNS